jgi:hypothetical protein
MDFTPEQEAYARQFALERATTMLEPEVDELAAEDHLRRAYQVAGLVPPRIRWFDSPLAFNQARELEAETEQARDQEAKERWDDMQACITRLLVRMGLLPLHIYQRKRRGAAAVQLAGTLALGGAMVLNTWLLHAWVHQREWLWDIILMLYVAVLLLLLLICERRKKRLHRDRQSWGKANIWRSLGYQMNVVLYDRLGLLEVIDRVGDENIIWNQVASDGGRAHGVRAYGELSQLAVCWFLHDVFEPNRLIHLARFNELVSGYYLGHKQAWLVRKPMRMQQDADGFLHADSRKCLEYRDGWGVYAWHGPLRGSYNDLPLGPALCSGTGETVPTPS